MTMPVVKTESDMSTHSHPEKLNFHAWSKHTNKASSILVVSLTESYLDINKKCMRQSLKYGLFLGINKYMFVYEKC